MTNKIEKLVEKCKSIIPLEGRILIHPLKLKTYKETQMFPTGIPYPEDEKELKVPEIQEGIPDDEEFPVKEDPVIQTEEREVEISKRFQEAVVLKLPEGETRFNVGDTIIYNVGSIFEFDFIKGVSIIYKYDPVGLIKPIKVKEESVGIEISDNSNLPLPEKFPGTKGWDDKPIG